MGAGAFLVGDFLILTDSWVILQLSSNFFAFVIGVLNKFRGNNTGILHKLQTKESKKHERLLTFFSYRAIM